MKLFSDLAFRLDETVASEQGHPPARVNLSGAGA